MSKYNFKDIAGSELYSATFTKEATLPINAHNRRVDVSGWTLEIDAFPSLSLLLHWFDGCWNVTEVTSGFRVASADTRRAAIRSAIWAIARKGIDNVEARITSAIDRNGLAKDLPLKATESAQPLEEVQS